MGRHPSLSSRREQVSSWRPKQAMRRPAGSWWRRSCRPSPGCPRLRPRRRGRARRADPGGSRRVVVRRPPVRHLLRNAVLGVCVVLGAEGDAGAGRRADTAGGAVGPGRPEPRADPGSPPRPPAGPQRSRGGGTGSAGASCRQVGLLSIRRPAGNQEPLRGDDEATGTLADTIAKPVAEQEYDDVLSGIEVEEVRVLADRLDAASAPCCLALRARAVGADADPDRCGPGAHGGAGPPDRSARAREAAPDWPSPRLAA